MANTPRIVTYRDAIENLMRYAGGNALAAGQEDFRQAIQAAYLELIQDRRWQYLTSIQRIHFDGAADTGTIAYDHTGGAYERMVTLTGSTWPDWAIYGELWIDGTVYRIDEIISTTVVTLEENSNPGEDIAANTEYQLVRLVYTLPNYFVSGDELNLGDSAWTPSYVSADEWLRMRRLNLMTGTPYAYAIIGLPELMGQLSLAVWPAPSVDGYADMVIRRRGRDIKLDGFADRLNAGRVTIATGSATVTGAGTNFDSDMRGAVIRVSATPSPPTGEFGLNPFVEQRSVSVYVNSSEITMDTVASNSLSNVSYIISDQIDIHADMVNAFYRGCELQLCYTRESRKLPMAIRAYDMALNLARSSDNRSMQSKVVSGPCGWRTRLSDTIPVRIANQE